MRNVSRRNWSRTAAARTDPVLGSARAATWRVVVLLFSALLFVGLGATACGSGTVHSPFRMDAGSEAGAAGAADDDGGLNVGVDAGDPTLGGPCADDAQCDDQLDCTEDHCDQALQRCRHTPDSTQCADDVYCNGEEVCDPKLGCRAGAAVSCSDSDTCTIDTCLEKTQSCQHDPRDADGDGDPVWNCAGGGDCDDTDPTVSSKTKEVCGNQKDDDCDGMVDEKDCVSPQYDTCSSALVISESGFTSLSLTATKLDYPTSCAPSDQNLGDVVIALTVPAGPAQDIDVVVQSSAALVSLATSQKCGVIANAACAPSVSTPNGALARLHLYQLAPGVYPLYVAGSAQADLALAVTYSAESNPPTNETCGTAAPLTPGQAQTATLTSATQDLTSACDSQTGELVYTFTLDEAQDVRVFGSPLDGYGVPQLSLRGPGCSGPKDELTCRVGAPSAALFARALPPGTYFVSVAGSGPTSVDVRLEVSPATSAPPDEGCVAAPALTPGETAELSLTDHADAVDVGCLPGAPDSSHSLTLAQTSDVLLVERISMSDTAAVSLALPSCAAATRLACSTGSTSPVRAHAFAVAPGTYRVIAESASSNPLTLTAYTRKAVPATLVALADDCSAPFEIPESGGRFKGNTANAHADYAAGCDIGNQGKGGAPDQMLHLKLTQKSHVIFDMSGSGYSTLLAVRAGDSCPGTELPFACAAGYQASRSFLDLDLDSGDYYVQVDGYAGDAGAWSLDVYVTPDSI